MSESLLLGSDDGETEPEIGDSGDSQIVESIRKALLERFLTEGAVNHDTERDLTDRVYMVNVTSKMHADVVVCGHNRCREFVEKSAGKMSIQIDEDSGNFEKGPFRRLKIAPTMR